MGPPDGMGGSPACDPGDRVEIELLRDGKRETVTATLGGTRTARGAQGMPRQHWMQPPAGPWPRSMQEFMEMFDQPAGPPQRGPFAPPPGAGPGGDATLDRRTPLTQSPFTVAPALQTVQRNLCI